MRRLISLFHRHRHAKWALTDQAVVSGSNFITGILLARFLGPVSFGMFVLLQSIILYVNSFQGALIFQPMMSAAPQLSETERANYLQGVFALQLSLCFGISIIVGLLALFAHSLGLPAQVGLDSNTLMALIAALLAFQMQDWQRRFYFVQEKAGCAFFIDVISYGSQITLLGVAFVSETLTVATAFWIIAGASFTAFAVGFTRHSLQPVFSHARSVLRDGWRTGRDYLAAWQFQWLGSQGVFMLAAGVVGTHAVGGVRATQNIIGPINIMFLAMDNLIPIAAAKRYSTGGLHGLSKYLWRITFVGTCLLAPVLLLLAVFAAPIMHVLYGEQYVAFAVLVYWQAAYIFILFYLRQTFFFLRTVRASGIILRSGILMALVSITIAALTVHRYHEVGLMLALLCAVCTGLIYTAAASRRLTTVLKKSTQSQLGSSLDNRLNVGGKA